MPWRDESRVSQRHRLVLALLRAEKPVTQLCAEAGVSRQTAYKFLLRYQQKGRAGLGDQRRCNRRSSKYRRARRCVLALRRHRPSWGARKLLHRLKQTHRSLPLPGERMVQYWLQRAGLARRQKRKRTGHGLVPRPVQALVSNAVWTADFKGWFRTTDGSKIEPLTVRDLYSKYVLAAEPMRSLSTAQLRRSFRRLFKKYGQPQVILTDRGAPFCGTGPYGLTQLSVWWHRLGIKVQFVSRKHRIDNNAHEQMHQVLQKELAHSPACNFRQQCAALEKWRHTYNYVRPHEAIHMQTPAALYRANSQALQPLRQPRYPADWIIRTVKVKGDIRVQNQIVGIGRAFAKLSVGLKPIGPKTYQTFFAELPLGKLHFAPDCPAYLKSE